MPKKKVITDIVEELKELTQIRDTQPIVTSVTCLPNGNIVGIDKDGKLWRYDSWDKLWRAY
jgi:hypothetical protein